MEERSLFLIENWLWVTLIFFFILCVGKSFRTDKKLSSFCKILEDGLGKVERQNLELKHGLQELRDELNDFTIRTRILETRFEERTISFFQSQSMAKPQAISQPQIKRGRPRKNPVE